MRLLSIAVFKRAVIEFCGFQRAVFGIAGFLTVRLLSIAVFKRAVIEHCGF